MRVMDHERVLLLAESFPELFFSSNDFRDTIVCRNGWLPVINALCIDLMASDRINPITLIKQKFGSMRIHLTHNLNEHEDDAVVRAAALALQTCEICGGNGQMRNDRGVYFVGCDLHTTYF